LESAEIRTGTVMATVFVRKSFLYREEDFA